MFVPNHLFLAPSVSESMFVSNNFYPAPSISGNIFLLSVYDIFSENAMRFWKIQIY